VHGAIPLKTRKSLPGRSAAVSIKNTGRISMKERVVPNKIECKARFHSKAGRVSQEEAPQLVSKTQEGSPWKKELYLIRSSARRDSTQKQEEPPKKKHRSLYQKHRKDLHESKSCT
jgi:hypothetical protein